MAHEESFETVAGCKIRVLRAGTGTPLLMLHGAAGAGSCIPLMNALSDRYQVIVPEHPGFGQSETPDWLDNIGDLAFFYMDLIEQFGLRDVNIVGASIGGWIAAEIATRSCERLRSIALLAPAGIRVKGERMADMFLWSPEETAANLFHDQELAKAMPQPANEEELLLVLKNRQTTAMLGWQPRMHNPHLAKWLHRVSVPTLVVWGDDDKLIPPAYGPAYRDLIPGAQLHMIADCGHLPHVEKTADLTDKLATFIQGAA